LGVNLSRPALILLSALLAVFAIAPAASSASTPRPALASVSAGHAVRGGQARKAKIRHRKAQRRTTAVAPAVPVKEGTASTSAVAAPAAKSSGLLFDGNFDSGFGDWYVQSLSSRATLFSSGAFEGSQAARFEVQQGDVEPDTGSQRSEVSGPTFDEGEDLYIRDAIRVPSGNTFNVPWQIVQQLHEEDWSGSPGMAVMLDNKHSLKLGSGDGSRTFWQGPVVQSDRWYDLVYRVNLSQDPGSGFVEVWLNGAQQTLANGQTRIYGETIQAAQTYLKAGIYRSKSSTGTSIVEHDAIVVGSSYAAVTS
jgi:Polysaccharide lyase